VFNLASVDTMATSLAGGGNDVIFNRLSGETGQSGTITVYSSATGGTKIVTIYKTGVVQFQ